MTWLPFVALFVSALGAAALALYAFNKAHKAEWAPEREATRRLRLIQGEGAEVHEFRRGRVSLMLHPRGIGVPDWPPPFRFALPDNSANARTFEPFIAMCLPDEDAWAALFSDEHRLKTFRHFYGNREGRKPKAKHPTLFETDQC